MLRFTDQFKYFVKHAIRMNFESQAAAILLLLESSADWKRLKTLFETSHKQYWENRVKLLGLTEKETTTATKSNSTNSVQKGNSITAVKTSPSTQSTKPVSSESVEKTVQIVPTFPPLPRLIVVTNTKEELTGATEEGFACIELGMPDYPTNDRLTQALLEAISDELIPTRSSVVALYSAFGADEINSISLTHLDEHFDKLTIHDLRSLEATVPLDVLKVVVDLAIEIGRDGREGKPVGTLFVIGDVKKVLEQSHSAGFDPVRGYSREERNLMDSKVREGIKEIAQLDGGFIVSPKGIVEAACKTIVSPEKNITLSKGLGTRHWAAAAISRSSNVIAVTVSQSSGTVRIFMNGEVVLRIEQTKRRPVIWRDSDSN